MPKGGDDLTQGGMRISPHPVRLEDYGNLYGANEDFYLNLNLCFLGFVHISHLLSVDVRNDFLTNMCV